MAPTKHNFQIARADEFIALIEQRLPEKTLLHTLSVAAYMAALAEKLGLSREDAVIAGLLHDLNKGYKKSELVREAEAYGIEISPVQVQNPKLLHGPVAAEECRHALGIESAAVYEAIYWHTTGCPGLGPIGLALFYADFSEPLRERPQAGRARGLCATEGFYRALYFVATEKIRYVRAHAAVDPLSEAFYEWIGQELLSQGHLSHTDLPVGRTS